MVSSFRRLHKLGSCLKPSSGVSYFPYCGFTEPRQEKKQIEFSSAQLKSFRFSSKLFPIDQAVHQTLKDYGILKPFRGCRAGSAVKTARITSSF